MEVAGTVEPCEEKSLPSSNDSDEDDNETDKRGSLVVWDMISWRNEGWFGLTNFFFNATKGASSHNKDVCFVINPKRHSPTILERSKLV